MAWDAKRDFIGISVLDVTYRHLLKRIFLPEEGLSSRGGDTKESRNQPGQEKKKDRQDSILLESHPLHSPKLLESFCHSLVQFSSYFLNITATVQKLNVVYTFCSNKVFQ